MLKATVRAWIVGSIALGFLETSAAATASRLLTVEDVIAVHEVSDPRLSPDGQWVAYVVRTADPVKDKHSSHIPMRARARHAGAQMASRSPS
jgi:hypothetical protein